MKRYLLLISAILLFISHQAVAQDYQKKDSLVINWLNNIALNAELPCDKIRSIAFDTIGKTMVEQNTHFLYLTGLKSEVFTCDTRKSFIETALPFPIQYLY